MARAARVAPDYPHLRESPPEFNQLDQVCSVLRVGPGDQRPVKNHIEPPSDQIHLPSHSGKCLSYIVLTVF